MAGDTLPTQPPGDMPNPEAVQQGVAEAEQFLQDMAPHLGRLFGMDLNIRIGDAWETNLDTGEVTADPSFFIEKGFTPDMSSYATLHEVVAHLRELVDDPQLADRVKHFGKELPANHLFYNIFSDIAGNNLIHAALPRMQDTAAQMYSEKLFPDVKIDPKTGEEEYYTDLPRHVQFLYKIIREEMIPDSQTEVNPEVQQAIDGLRDYQGQGDLIKYSTAAAKSSREVMDHRERFTIWTSLIHPVFKELLDQDRQDPKFPQSGESNQSSSESGQPGESPAKPQSPGQQSEKDKGQFGQYYEDYEQNKHPEPMSHEEHDKIHDHARKAEHDKRTNQTSRHEKILDQQIREETGHSLQEQRQYDAEVQTWQSAIEEMREVFQRVIHERTATKRGLSRRTLPEGAILDPDRLSQTIIDMRTGTVEPEVFRDYETLRGQTETIGKTDYVFLFDVSGSMSEGDGSKAKAAASSAVIGLEGLSALQRDIEEAEATNKIELELDIRTAMYTFGSGSECLKPLSTKITPKQRLDAYSALRKARDGSTQDFIALEEIQKLSKDADRRRILIVVSDGKSDNQVRARNAIDSLRGDGWFVYGIGIGSDAATNLYQPTSRRVDNPEELPTTIHNFLEATVS